MNTRPRPGQKAIAAKGWLRSHRWLILRRLSQFSILGLFLLGPWASTWIVEGNLASSRTLGVLDLTDPYVFLQSLAAGHLPAASAAVGALIVFAFYILAGGRVYCSWVCPVNIVTDAAHWTRERLGLRATIRLDRNTRYWVLGMTLIAAFVTGGIAWETVNPVSMLHRGLIFGMGLAWTIVLAVFLFDLFVARRGWCGYLCPVGAFYGLIGPASLLRIRADARARCDDCADCYPVCPEPQVLGPVLKGTDRGPVILSSACTNCGRCIDVCHADVFRFGSRFHNQPEAEPDSPEQHRRPG